MRINDPTVDLYAILGLDKQATADDIKYAYWRLARTLHPDVSDDPEAHKRYAEAAQAYDTLGNSERRQQYDEERSLLGRHGTTGRRSSPRPPDSALTARMTVSVDDEASRLLTAVADRLSSYVLLERLEIFLQTAQSGDAAATIVAADKAVPGLQELPLTLTGSYAFPTAAPMAKLAAVAELAAQAVAVGVVPPFPGASPDVSDRPTPGALADLTRTVWLAEVADARQRADAPRSRTSTASDELSQKLRQLTGVMVQRNARFDLYAATYVTAVQLDSVGSAANVEASVTLGQVGMPRSVMAEWPVRELTATLLALRAEELVTAGRASAIGLDVRLSAAFRGVAPQAVLRVDQAVEAGRRSLEQALLPSEGSPVPGLTVGASRTGGPMSAALATRGQPGLRSVRGGVT